MTFWTMPMGMMHKPMGGGGLVPTYVGGVAVAAVSTASISVPAISGVQEGDLLLCFLMDTLSVSGSITSRPSGFSNVLARSNGDGGNAIIDIKVATGSEPPSYAWTWSNSLSTYSIKGVMAAYRGATGVNASSAAFDAGSGTTQVLSSITPTARGALIAFFSNRSPLATITTAPSGMTQRVTTQGLSSTSPLTILDLIPSSGATGTKTAVWSRSQIIVGALVQIA